MIFYKLLWCSFLDWVSGRLEFFGVIFYSLGYGEIIGIGRLFFLDD